MPRESRAERIAREAAEAVQQQASQSSADFQRAAAQSHSNFEATTESSLGSGQSQTPEPAQAGGGSLEFLTMTLTGVVTALGSAAAATLIRRSRR